MLLIFGACSQKVTYLDSDYPNLEPKKYAKGIINVEGRFQQNLTMSPDGKEHLLTITDSEEWRYQNILRVRNLGNEIVTDTPSIITDFEFSNVPFIGEPMISPDNQSLFFIADYPPDLWRSKRQADGEWSVPYKMSEVSTDKDDWYPTLSKNNTLYFTNGTVYQSTPKNSKYVVREEIQSEFNTQDARDACISPNEDYIIFTAIDSLGYGKSDLYISFKNEKGIWSKSINLGNSINTEHREFAPYISPDEQFLFFSRRDTWQNAKFSNIYWVSLKVIDGLNPNK